MELRFAGAVLDGAVTDLSRAEAFYATLLGAEPNLSPQPDQREWRLHGDPEVALRLTTDLESAGHGTLALGVTDLASERLRLLTQWPCLPAAVSKPGVITRLTFRDPDGNAVTLWQDLMGARRAGG